MAAKLLGKLFWCGERHQIAPLQRIMVAIVLPHLVLQDPRILWMLLDQQTPTVEIHWNLWPKWIQLMEIVSGREPRHRVKRLLAHPGSKLISSNNKLSNHLRHNYNTLLLQLRIMGPLLLDTRTLILVIVTGMRAPRYGKESNITITTSTIPTTITTPHHQGTRPSECHRQLTQSLFAVCQSSRTVGDTCSFILFVVVFVFVFETMHSFGEIDLMLEVLS